MLSELHRISPLPTDQRVKFPYIHICTPKNLIRYMSKVNVGRSLLLCLALVVTSWGTGHLSAQFLNWNYYNLLDEDRESGARPDMEVDRQGNLHVVYWQAEEDRAIYMQRSGGSWIREYIQPATSNGYVVRLVLDNNDVPHVVFMENNNTKAEYRYGYRVGPSTWVIEDIPSDPVKAWGEYGPDAPTVSSNRIQHSADIWIEPDGTPQILFFDGWVSPGAFPFCNSGSNYEFEMIQATKKSGLWLTRSFGEVPDLNASCGDPGVNPFALPLGDRYGEFPAIVQKSDGSLEAFCHSRFNNHILRFQTTFNDTTWSRTVLDSLANRIDFASFSWATRFFTFQGVEAVIDQNDDIHMVYGSSFDYGDNFFGLTETNVLVYTKVIGDDSVYTFNFGNPGSYTYRPYSDIAISGPDTIAVVYSDLTTFELQTWTSYDGGANWNQSKIADFLGSARTPITCDGDSFYVAYYNSDNDALYLASQELPQGQPGTPSWTTRQLTTSQNHGQSFDGTVQVQGSDTVSHIAFNDSYNEMLFYGTGSIAGTWNHSYDTLDLPGHDPRAISLTANASGIPLVAYSFGNEGDAKLAVKQNGTWSYEVLADSANATYTDIAISPLDTIHYAYFDGTRQCLRYFHRHLNDVVWIQDSIDCDTLPIGEFPSIALEGEIPHVAYYDDAGLQLKYARRNPSTRIWEIDTVITTVSSPVGKFNSLQLTSTGLPKIACLDEQNTHVLLAEKDLAGDWTVTKVDTSEVSNLGRPTELVIDQFDNVWIAYNTNQNIDRVKLMHRDSQWREVAVSSTGRIANEFHFEIIGGDLYLAGKKNEPQNTGLAMITAPGGVFVEQTEAQNIAQWVKFENYPNPFSQATNFQIQLLRPETLSLSVYDLNGRKIGSILDRQRMQVGTHRLEWNAEGLSPGIYLGVLENEHSRILQKLVISN